MDYKTHIGRVKGVMRMHNVDLDTASRTVNLARKLSPLDIKPEMYKPLLHFKEVLPYERAAEKVALRRAQEEQRTESIFANCH